MQYSLNRDHLAAAAVIELTSLRRQFIQRIRDAIEQWPTRPLHASVFGSTARGDSHLHSDVDLLIVHEFAEPPPEWADQVGSLAEQVHSWTGNHLQLYELSNGELLVHIEAGEPIVDDWLRDCITVDGPDFRHLRNRVVHGVTPQ